MKYDIKTRDQTQRITLMKRVEKSNEWQETFTDFEEIEDVWANVQCLKPNKTLKTQESYIITILGFDSKIFSTKISAIKIDEKIYEHINFFKTNFSKNIIKFYTV